MDKIEAYFFDDSDSTNVPITNWEWDFGDTLTTSDTSVLEDPLPYIYTTWGQFDISLIITDQNGCQDIDTHTITIYISNQLQILIPTTHVSYLLLILFVLTQM